MRRLAAILVILVLLGAIVFTFAEANTVQAQDPTWASLVQPRANGSFNVRNETDFTIWVRGSDNNPRSEPIAARSVSSQRWQYIGEWGDNLGAFCSENPTGTFDVPWNFMSENQWNTSILRFPCNVLSGSGNTGSNTTSPPSVGGSSDPGVTCVTPNGSNMNVRSGPGTDFNIVGRLPYGSCYEFVATASNGWFQVQLPSGQTGFVSNAYTSIRNGNSNSVGSSSETLSVCGTVEGFNRGLIMNRASWMSIADANNMVQSVAENVIPVSQESNLFWNAPIIIAFMTRSELRRISQYGGISGVTALVKYEDGCIYPSTYPTGETYRMTAVTNNSVSTTWHELAHAFGADHGPLCGTQYSYRNMALSPESDACAWAIPSIRAEILSD